MDNVREIFKNSDGWNEGHTSFKNGYHGNGWVQKDVIVRNPLYLDQVTKFQADQIIEEFSKVDLVLGPVTGGVLVASSVGRHLGKEIGVILGKQDPIRFHEMNIPQKGRKVIIVDDTISSGIDMTRFVKFVKHSGAELLGVSVWMNRQSSEIDDVKVISLMKTPFKLYALEDCPLCKSGVPLKYENIRE